MAKELNAGFTGAPIDPPEGLRKVAQSAVSAVKGEAQSVARGAADHPHTATTVVLAVGFLAFCLGYLMGRSSVATDHRYWW